MVNQREKPPSTISTQITHRKLGVLLVETYENGEVVRSEERGDPLDILALAFFVGTFASFTLGFSALGIYTYEQGHP